METILTFLRHQRPLCKKITPDFTEPYPLVKSISSIIHTIPHTPVGLKEKYHHIQRYARHGMAMQKGPLLKVLDNESRANQTDKGAMATYVVLDFDKVPVDFPLPEQINRDTVVQVAEFLLQQLPEVFHQTSYVALASNSFGLRKNQVSLHIQLLLHQEIHPQVLKQCLTHLNMTVGYLEERIGLSASGSALTWPLDPSVADNSKIIYIAPPQLEGVPNPFEDDEQRIVLVEKDQVTLDLGPLIDEIDFEVLERDKRKLINKIRRRRGLPSKPSQTSPVRGVHGEVVTNPDNVFMQYVRDNDEFVYYNINGGDSNAYYVRKSRAEIVLNFKGEPPFLFKVACPDMYEEHLQRFPVTLAEGEDETPRPYAFIDHESDTYMVGFLNVKKHRLENLIVKRDVNRISQFFKYYGEIAPDPFPHHQYVFDPTNPVLFDPTPRPKFGFVNKFTPPDLFEAEIAIPDEYQGLTADTQSIAGLCPLVHKIIFSLTGCTDGGNNECYGHLLNWVAFIVQKRKQTETSWLFQGVQGTGKGLFAKVLQDIFSVEGENRYVRVATIDQLDEDKNAWEEHALITFVDEFHMSDSKHNKRLNEKLKNRIVTDTVPIRAMRANHREARSYNNWLFATNRHGAATVEETDRRSNICPRQEVKLIDRFPDIPTLLTGGGRVPKEEVKKFVALLMAFEVDVRKAMTPLENEAKQHAKEASRTSIDEFVRNFKAGNLDYFIDILEYDTDSMNGIKAKNIVKAWLRDSMNGHWFDIPNDQLRLVYNGLISDNISSKKFTTMMGHKGLYNHHKRVDGKLIRAWSTMFHVEPTTRQTLIKQYLTDNEIQLSDNPEVLALIEKNLN